MHCRTAVASALLLVALAAGTFACDTPVYRYAMYRWEPSPYEVYHFHSADMQQAFTSAKEQLNDARNEKVSPLNVAVYPVDLAKDAELKTVPRDVRRIWQQKVEEGIKTPATLIVNPKGYEVHCGPLAKGDVAAIASSPARKQIGKLLSKGHCGVYVLVLGKDNTLNKAAKEAVAKVVKDVNSGDLSLYTGPDAVNPLGKPKQDAEDKQEGDEKAPHSAVSLTFTQKELQAKDPWLYRSLLSVENDLHEFQDEPMLFVVYGRGRALPPYIGKGIVYENLVEVTDFITSACSCTVKDQNPGVDLLMSFDWDSASASVAERFGSEEGNNETLDDLFPQLIFPGKTPAKEEK